MALFSIYFPTKTCCKVLLHIHNCQGRGQENFFLSELKARTRKSELIWVKLIWYLISANGKPGREEGGGGAVPWVGAGEV
jgi:hypothetical protein